MFDVLTSYLIQHNSISIPGLGTIYMEKNAASVDARTQQMAPPQYYYRFDKYFDSPDRKFFSYLATQQGVADFEAMRTYNEFAQQLRERIQQEDMVNWEGVGQLARDQEGNIVFESLLINPSFVMPVSSRKVIHPDAKHLLLVGDRQRTTTEMNDWLRQGKASSWKSSWWLYALLAAILSIMVLLFHFAYNGWQLDAAGNQQKLQVDK